jgi:hypothetical protein
LVAWLFVFASPRVTRADESAIDDATRNAARELARDGLERMRDKRWAEALTLLGRAYQLVPAPTVALLKARAQRELGQLVEAAERYEVARQPLADTAPPAYLQAADHAEIELAALRPTIPRLSVFVGAIPPEIGPGTVQVLLDDHPVPQALIGVPRTVNPGRHTLVLSIGGREVDRRVFEVSEFERTQIVLRAEVGPPPPPPPVLAGVRFPGSVESAIGWTALSAGIAGLAVGVTAGAISESDHAELTERCPVGACPADRHEQLDDFRTMRTVSTVGYIAGATFSVAGLVLVWHASTERVPAEELTVVVGPSAVGVDLRF